MAQLPRHRTTHLIPALACVLWLAIASPAVAVDLIGTWHVLVHYRDANAPNKELERWGDKVWVFEPSGSRIRWTEYPIVVFADETGRFENLGGSGAARVLHFWEPSPAQLADIMDGLEYITRGSKTKTLRGSDAKGWKSRGGSTAMSASVITYSELWSIEGMPDRPVFSRSDIMGSARSETLEGGTLYEASEVSADGNVIRGRYDRDGTRTGTFRMLRAGALAKVAGRSREELDKTVVATIAGVGPVGADVAHDDDVRYQFPFDAGTPHRLVHGARSGRHKGAQKWGFDFELARREDVLAARDGRVQLVIEDFTEPGSDRPTTALVVQHDDGTGALYGNLLPQVSVRQGQKVRTGDRLGLSAGPAVHFSVSRLPEDFSSESVEIRFEDGSAEGLLPVKGASYGEQGALAVDSERVEGIEVAQQTRETEPVELALHDDDVRYAWPFDVANPRRLLAGPGGGVSMTALGAGGTGGHAGTQRWGFDFELPKGAEVRAARDGELMGEIRFTERDRSLGAARPTTAVQVRHDDGTWALYGHLLPELPVKVGQKVQTGDRLGFARGQHLHFSVHRTGEKGRVESLEIRFEDGSPEGVVPVTGASYGAKRTR